MENIYILKTFKTDMKKEMFSLVFLLSLFLISFVAAETYTSTTVVAFNSGNESTAAVNDSGDYTMWKNVSASVALVLIVIAAIMIYKKRKAKKKSKAVKKKVAKKVSNKRTAKKKKRK